MFYTIYKVTNKVNGKYYIGKHQTKNLDDRYMGSGKLLKRAIAKYGIENFEKRVLHVFETEQEMNQKEAELVIIGEQTYNLCPGGHGGFGYINGILTTEERRRRGIIGGERTKQRHLNDLDFHQKMSALTAKRNRDRDRQKLRSVFETNRRKWFKGEKRPKETCLKISASKTKKYSWRCLKTKEIFIGSMLDLANKVGVKQTTIRSACGKYNRFRSWQRAELS